MPLLPDELDFFIIKKYLLGKEIKKKEVVRGFKWDNFPAFFVNKYHEKQFFDKKVMLINYRLKKMAEEGFLRFNGNKKEPEFIKNRIMIEKHKFPDARSEAILIKNKENKWDVFQL